MTESQPASSGGWPLAPGLDSRTWAAVATVLVASPILLVFITPAILAILGRVVGFALRRKTSGRRQTLLAAMDEEDQKFWQENTNTKDSPSDEWETIDGASVADLGDASKTNKDWNGIVGFFHPFWYAVLYQTIMNLITNYTKVTPAEVESEFSGRRFGQHRAAGPRLNASSTLVTTT